MLNIKHYQVVLLFLSSLSSGCMAFESLSPVLLVPGLAGSRLESRWNTTSTSEDGKCFKSEKWRTVWLDFTDLIMKRAKCVSDELKLNYDEETGTTSDKPGLTVRVSQENLEAVRNVQVIADHTVYKYKYFHKLARWLIDQGYKESATLDAAPYDFRKAPNELGDYLDYLGSKIESLFWRGGGVRVTIICHSMGCLNTLFFLHRQQEEWKFLFIGRLITIGAPWGGSMKALLSIARGLELGSALSLLVDRQTTADLLRSFPSLYYLLPNEQVYKDKTLVTVNPGRATEMKYTAASLGLFIKQLKLPHAFELWNTTKNLLDRGPPGVETFCIVGTNQKTIDRIEFESSDPDSEYTAFYGDGKNGDAVVDLTSATHCQEWSDQQKHLVTLHKVSASHVEILNHPHVLNLVAGILNNNKETTKGLRLLQSPRFRFPERNFFSNRFFASNLSNNFLRARTLPDKYKNKVIVTES